MSRDRTKLQNRGGDAGDDFVDEFDPTDDSDRKTATDSPTDSFRSRLRSRASRVFSPRLFLIALVLTAGGLFAASTLVPLPGAGLLGVFAGAFLFGMAVDGKRYVETALAGGVATGASTLLDFAVVAFFGGFGVSIALLSGAIGALVGGLGVYFGRDLRDGLTRDL